MIVSSPYPRAKETIRPLAELLNLPILLEEDFRERKIGCWVEDFNGYCKRQWEDFSYALPEGESLQQVQQRVVQALEVLLSLIHILSDRAKIIPRRVTGTCARHQRQLTVAVKRARHVAFLPYVGD